MFTGIVEEVGRIVSVRKKSKGVELTVNGKITTQETKLGDSISVNGVCLTVTEIGKDFFSFFISYETLRRTNLKEVKPGDFVNLERALTLNSRLGGHIVQGHVDTTTKVTRIKKEGESFKFYFSLPLSFSHLIVEKGSVAVDGISLTVAEILSSEFSVAVIPYTYESTNLKFKRAGDNVNLEFDIIGKYVERMLKVPQRGT